MKDAYWFKHDANARNDQRLIEVQMKYGNAGYGTYFKIIEIMREQENYKLEIKKLKALAYDVRDTIDVVNDIVKNYGLFEIDDTYFYSKSFLRRMNKLDDIKEIRREAGKKGGIAKAKAYQKPSKSVANTNQKSSDKIREDKIRVDKKREKSKEKISLSFDLFWNLYDYKQLRPDCEAIWNGEKKNKRGMLLDNEIRQEILDHLPSYVQSTYKNGDFPQRKHPKTYLNNNGWEDEVVVVESDDQTAYKLDSCGFPMAYCESCSISDSYRQEELNGDSRCCNAKLLPNKPKGISNNGRSKNLVDQSKRYRRHIKGQNNRKTGLTEIGQILGQTLEKFKPETTDDEEGDGQQDLHRD